MHDSNTRKLLYLCRQWPYPPHGGALMRNYSMIETLGKMFEVDVVCPGTRGDENPPVHEAHVIPSHSSAMKSCLRRLNYVYRRRPFFLADVYPKKAYRIAREKLLDGAYDAVHVSELGAANLMPRGHAAPVVYDSHNYEAGLLFRRAEKEKPPVAQLIKRDARLVQRFETMLIRRAQLTLAVSESDRQDLAELVPQRRDRIFVADNAIDTRLYAPSRERTPEPHSVLITGTLTWRPNIQGLRWFIEQVLPVLSRAVPDVVVRVAGRMSDEMKSELNGIPHVQAVQSPPDMVVEFATASVVAIPVLASSGTRFRILEAWAAGRPLVTTHAGAFGLPGNEGTHYRVQDQPADFATAIVELLTDREHWKAVQQGGYDMIRLYDFDALRKRLIEAYATLFPEWRQVK